ncbi:Sgf11 (Transcriptional regulation protein) protein [Quillaja saponaria]|uniref:Sgf11 (Transcriptional regulation protein) protein n=1 Tax=Quillaja saponaria TaxID=32244 RepID=A0AAD7QEW6_QUISA|nr:Sgf11 (Transcriptional regulation protein) protein [Quillaja saponaria]
MMCSFESGRMAVMARLMAAGRFSQTISDEIGHRKSAAECLCRELREADEATLLDEEDMHVFGLKPMIDPLELVLCNDCKKPVKSSQFVAHAELCRSLKCVEETVLELHGSTGNRKPPRKEKKKFLTSHAMPSVVKQERYETLNTTSESHFDIQSKVTSLSNEAKGNSASVHAASLMDGSGVYPGNRDHQASVMPPTKRPKLIAGEHLSLSDNSETVFSLTKITSFPDGFLCKRTCRNFPEGMGSGCGNPKDCVIDHKIHGQDHEEHLIKKDFPVPLATKIYYSQRNSRLRSALGHLYFQASSKEECADVSSSNLLNESATAFQASPQMDSLVEQMDDVLNKSQLQILYSVQRPNQNLAKGSEICMSKASGHLASSNFSNPFPVDNVIRSAAAPLGLIRSNYLSKPYSFSGNSGKPLGTFQQPKESVHVI